MILLYMRTLEGHIRLRLGVFGLTTALAEGPALADGVPYFYQADLDDSSPVMLEYLDFNHASNERRDPGLPSYPFRRGRRIL